jgi:tol-pal system protein YbgF
MLQMGLEPRGSLLELDMKIHAHLGCLAIVTILVGAGCFTAENAERRQLAALEKGIESDRFAVDRQTPRVDEQVEPEGVPASVQVPRHPEVPTEGSPERANEVDEAGDTTPRTVIKIWGKSMPSVEVVSPGVPAKEAPGAGTPSTGAGDRAISANAPGPNGSGSNGAAQHGYDAALSLVNAHAYDKAAGALGLFLLEWPSDPNASNAMYWQAECYFAMGEYAHASELFEQAVDRFPKSSRAPDCLLKLGLCQQKLGDAARAKTYFERLGAEYPKSEAFRRVPPGI